MNAGGARMPSEEPVGIKGFRAMAGWMQELAPYGIFTTDAELRVRSWNHWLAVHSGRNAEDVVGRLIQEVVPDLTVRRITERFSRALAGEISVLSTALHKYLLPLPPTVPGSGHDHMLQTARIAPLREDGAIVGTITLIEDVTQREVQASILRRQQELDRLLSSSLATLLQANDPVQEIGTIFANISPALGLDAYVCYLLAHDGKTLQLNLSGGISPRQRESLATLPVLKDDECKLLSGANGTVVNLATHKEALRSLGLRGQCSFPLVAGSRVLGMVSFASYQKDAIASADLNVLSRIARYVTIALDRAIRERATLAASRAKDDFLAALSHELRTPLNPVLLLASDGASNMEFSASARETFRVIEKNALLEARLIDDLLDLTRISHGKLGLELQAFDVHLALNDALTTIENDAAGRNLTVNVDLCAKATTLMGDPARLQQVFWNVLKNSVKFTPHGGSLSVSTRSNDDGSQITILFSDTGIGMEPHEVQRVFDAFSQGDHADNGHSHRFGGLGLGLAISRKLVELHSGRIEATSQGKNQGSTFIVHLPLIADTVGRDDDSGRGGIQSENAAMHREPRSLGRILLVEDHESTRSSLCRLLMRKGYDVVAVASAADALTAVSNRPFDLVLSDIGLPDMDGFALMRSLRDRHGLRGIALTGYGMEADIARTAEVGFVGHLTKPISVNVLERALALALPSAILPENVTSQPA